MQTHERMLETWVPAEFYAVVAANSLALDSELRPFVAPDESILFVPKDVDLDGMVYTEGAGGKLSCLRNCPLSDEHVTHSWYDQASAEICGGENWSIPPLLRTGDPIVIVNGELATQLSQAGMKGLHVRPLTLVGEEKDRWRGAGISFLSGPLPLPRVPRRMNSSIRNRCPVCSWGPLFCEGCGHVEFKCPRCHHDILVNSKSETNGKTQFSLDELFPKELNESAGAIIYEHATGIDFSGFNKFSRRAVEFLIEFGAYPLDITPLKVQFPEGAVGYSLKDIKTG